MRIPNRDLDLHRARVLGLPYFWEVTLTCTVKKKLLIQGNLIKMMCRRFLKDKIKILKSYFEVILFKSHKDKSFFVSPEPACLRHLFGFARLSTGEGLW